MKAFDANRTIDGYVVIATDTGHPVSRTYATLVQATARATQLNRALRKGGAAFRRAMNSEGRPPSMSEFISASARRQASEIGLE